MAARFCSQCGEGLTATARFCAGCGRPIAEGSPSQVAASSGGGGRALAERLAQRFRDRWLDGQNRSNRSRPKRDQSEDFWLWRQRGTRGLLSLVGTAAEAEAICADHATRVWLEEELVYTLMLARTLDRNQPTRQDMELWLTNMMPLLGKDMIDRALERVSQFNSVVEQPKRFGLF